MAIDRDALLEQLRARRAQVKSRTGRAPAKRKRLPRQAQPDAIRTGYFAELRDGVLGAARDAVNQVIGPALEQLLPVRTDGGHERAEHLVAVARQQFAATVSPSRLGATAAKYGKRISDFQRAELGKQFRAGLGVDPVIHEPHLQEQIDGFTAENVALIKSVPSQYFDQVEQVLQGGIRAGARPDEVAADLAARFGVAESRAKLIARDQTGKFFGELQESRQTDLGLKRYVWRTVQDNRVREEHAEREGESYDWSDPPEDGHPGKAINCRCYAEPDLSALLDGLEAPAPTAPSQPPAPPPPVVTRQAPAPAPPPPRDVEAGQVQLHALGPELFGSSFHNPGGITVGQSVHGNIAERDWNGMIMFQSDTKAAIAAALNAKGPVTAEQADSIHVWVHEELHGLGHWKAPVPAGDPPSDHMRTYGQKSGEALQEGAVELTSVMRYREVAGKLGVHIPENVGKSRTWSGGTLQMSHSYAEQVGLVESACHFAAGTAKDTPGDTGHLTGPGLEVLSDLLWKWKPSERPANLAAGMANHLPPGPLVTDQRRALEGVIRMAGEQEWGQEAAHTSFRAIMNLKDRATLDHYMAQVAPYLPAP